MARGAVATCARTRALVRVCLADAGPRRSRTAELREVTETDERDAGPALQRACPVAITRQYEDVAVAPGGTTVVNAAWQLVAGASISENSECAIVKVATGCSAPAGPLEVSDAVMGVRTRRGSR